MKAIEAAEAASAAAAGGPSPPPPHPPREARTPREGRQPSGGTTTTLALHGVWNFFNRTKAEEAEDLQSRVRPRHGG